VSTSKSCGDYEENPSHPIFCFRKEIHDSKQIRNLVNDIVRANYATVKIPQELAIALDEFVANMGYRSRAEIVNDAIRRFIDERKRLDTPRAKTEEPLVIKNVVS